MFLRPISLCLAALLGVSTTLLADQRPHSDVPEKPPMEGVAVIIAKQNSGVSGTLTFKDRDGKLHIAGEVKGLTPGKHGFHIHEFGDLRDPKGESAGPHYNPGGHKHGGPHDKERHAGDLGNIVADDRGVAKVDISVDGLELHFIIGRSIVVHQDPDDLVSQPAGDAGDRIGIGVIGIAQSKKAGE